MKTFPTIETERLILRQLRPEDSVDLYNYFSKDEVTEFYDLDSFTELQQAESLIRIFNDRFITQQGIRWGITLKTEDKVIGTCGFHNWSKKHFKAEIGYELSPEYWGIGVMTEVLREVINFGYKELELNRIEAFTYPDNIKSRKLLEKSGLSEEGYLKKYYYVKQRFVDAVIFSIIKEEVTNDERSKN
ncbi:ribosomal-protein-alanine N-acetyltransferase [Paenibacillus uliginis N3/975]|uniref:Ribosomal-protein-alanine N-acetyltransferase n=1 Tax=Paenibacillus uliginis N3/975 TaxID=1313296 RepID=A0A1X7H4D2_9BACL|nr:GNAT family protein [Paenibacillus uliginis]SMF79353.1 ribosomal-protein-alanine N-acetyltransferase [Paenibacillus uliginis N3/975]